LNELVCGIDEAGRGAVIGPLVMACAVLNEEGKEELKKLGVRDSKKVARSRRQSLEQKIKDVSVEYQIIRIQAHEIDRLRKKISLNVIEAQKAAQLILSLNALPDKIIVDAVDVVPGNYRQRIMESIPDERKNKINMISEHKADDKYIEVGAASILAKVERDRVIGNLHKELGNFGSGYPSDPRTIEFIEGLKGEFPDCVRKSWNTIGRLKDERKQTMLGDF